MGTYCGGLDFYFEKKADFTHSVPANVTIPCEDSEFWDNNNRDEKGNQKVGTNP